MINESAPLPVLTAADARATEADAERGLLRRIGGRLADQIDAEQERRLLWLPVFLATGVCLYFGLRAEPLPLSGALAAVTALLILARAGPEAVRLRAFALILFTVALGFAAAQLRTYHLDVTPLQEPIHGTRISGRVVAAAVGDAKFQVILDRVRVADLPAARTPQMVRLTGQNAPDHPPLRGHYIEARGGLFPPPGPPTPQAFDFQRHAYFLGLGAVGYLSEPPIRITGPPPDVWTRLGYALEDLRTSVSDRIVTAAPNGDAATVMTALMTGDRSHIPEDVLAAFRASGMAHLLAISGLHMTLVAGLVYLLTRRTLALWPTLALTRPIKKWAACAGLAAAIGYVLLVGSPVPTVRSVLMTGLVMAAILFDRNPFTLRTVAFAAFLLLLVRPESLLGASFQMSFAAVTALIAAFEVFEPRWRTWRDQFGGPLRWVLYFVALMASSLIASLATTPFSIYHFNVMANYGPIVNMIAVPLTAWWVMPWAVVAFAAMPLGLESLPLQAMSWGVEGLLWLAAFTARQPGAISELAAFPLSALVVLTLGGLWLCLWRGCWRLWGLGVLAIGAWLAIAAPVPDVLLHADGKTLAVNLQDGRLAVAESARNDFAVGVWLRRLGGLDPVDWPQTGEFAEGRLRCDPLGCIFRPQQDVRMVFPRTPDGQMEDCIGADAAFQRFPSLPCPADIALDRADLMRNGAYALRATQEGWVVTSTRAWRGERPWTVP